MTRPLVMASCLLALASACSHAQESGLVRSASSDRDAERVLTAANAHAEAGESAEAARAYESFLSRFAGDTRALEAELGLGRILLADGDVLRARERFERVRASDDPSIRDSARLYDGVALQIAGDSATARDMLEPLIGKLTRADENALLMRTLASAHEQLGDLASSLAVLAQILAAAENATEAESARTRIAMIVDEELSSADVELLQSRFPAGSAVRQLLVQRAMREAAAAGHSDRVRQLATGLDGQNGRASPELAAIVRRAELPMNVDPNSIGLLVSLSGAARTQGRAALDGALAAGPPARTGPLLPTGERIVARDTRSDSEAVARAVDDLVNLHRVVAIVGPTEPRECVVAATRARELGVPMLSLCSSPELESIGPWIFRMSAPPNTEIDALVDAAANEGLTRIAIARPETAAAEGAERALLQSLRARDLSFAGSFRYPEGTMIFADFARGLSTSSFDAVLVVDGPESSLSLAHALTTESSRRRSPLRVLFLERSFSESLASDHLDGSLVATTETTGTDSESVRAFRERFVSTHRTPPTRAALRTYDAITLVRRVVGEGARTREAVADALRTRTFDDTATGLTAFAPDRSPVGTVRVLKSRQRR